MSSDKNLMPGSNQIQKKKTISIALACFVVAAIAVISFLPHRDKSLLHTRGKYHSWGHLLAFSVVSFLIAKAAPSRSARILLFFGALALGFGIEYGEHLHFQNALEWKDILVDTIGTICGTLMAMATAPRD